MTRIYYKKVYYDHENSEDLPSFGWYYQENLSESDVTTEETFFTQYDKVSDLWYYTHEQDVLYREEIENRNNEFRIISEQEYIRLLQVINAIEGIKAVNNRMFELLSV